MSETVRLSVPMAVVGRGPIGPALATSTGRVNGMPFDVTVTEAEMHFAFADRDGPSFAVNLNTVAKEATNAIEYLMGAKRGLV